VVVDGRVTRTECRSRSSDGIRPPVKKCRAIQSARAPVSNGYASGVGEDVDEQLPAGRSQRAIRG
jgi:hypothetical protein